MSVRLGAITMLLFLLSATAHAGQPGGSGTRFQLFNGKYSGLSISKSKGSGKNDIRAFEGTQLFKIDSETGRTWILDAYMIDGKTTWDWVEIIEASKASGKESP